MTDVCLSVRINLRNSGRIRNKFSMGVEPCGPISYDQYKKMVYERTCEVGFTLAPFTIRSYNHTWLQIFGK